MFAKMMRKIWSALALIVRENVRALRTIFKTSGAERKRA